MYEQTLSDNPKIIKSIKANKKNAPTNKYLQRLHFTINFWNEHRRFISQKNKANVKVMPPKAPNLQLFFYFFFFKFSVAHSPAKKKEKKQHTHTHEMHPTCKQSNLTSLCKQMTQLHQLNTIFQQKNKRGLFSNHTHTHTHTHICFFILCFVFCVYLVSNTRIHTKPLANIYVIFFFNKHIFDEW